MEHQDAIRLMAVEKYLLKELPSELRDDFEAHYFDCQECANDLRATAAFLDAAREQLRIASVVKQTPAKARKRGFSLLWRPVFVVPALAASLFVIAYQNLVVYPRFTGEIAQLKTPEVLPSLSLVGGTHRGGSIPAITVRPAQPFLLFVDVPTQDRFASYTCTLYSPSGVVAWQVQVSRQQAEDTVAIRVPAVYRMEGNYVVLVRGNLNPAQPETSVDLARYVFTLKKQS
ncbi:MAG TPA: hypothetical protein VHX63_14405 [Acidobacteriaceae bacterium]|jgi:hypothetical protein|nr:hypothetical protein [Acidobacteriaceae bacterium]